MHKKSDIDRETLQIFWDIAFRYKALFFLGLFFPLGILLLGILAPLFAGKTLAALNQPNGEPFRYLVYFSAAAIAGLLCNRIGHPATVKHQARAMHDAQEIALSTLLKRSVGFHNNNMSGKLVSDAIDFPAAIGQLIGSGLNNVVPFALTLIIGSAVIFFESWQLGLFITCMTLVIVWLGLYDSRRMAPLRKERLKAGKDVTAHVADTVTNMQTVKTFGREAEELSEHDRLGTTLTDIRLTHWNLMSVRGNMRMAVLIALQIAFIFVVVTLVRKNPSLLGTGIFAFTFTLMLSNRLFEINLLFRNIEEALLQASPMTKIVLEAPEIQDKPNAKKLSVTSGAIDLRDVTFRYEDANSNESVFSNLNLAIKPGEKIGLVGHSGGGKSTLTRLLLRFDDIQSGSISFDGQNIADVTQKSLRQAISYVPQEPLLFHRSISENIAYGNPKATAAAIAKAAASAHADQFIEKLPNAYNTIVGERGVKLSGGQRQRVAIARAILKDAPILILDEATSALDSESEVLIQDALWKLMQGRTAIVIAHRLSTIQKMDRIVVLEDGKITEQGSHKTLLNQKGTYAKLWAHQSGGFIEE
jgi:ATP-binding cassette subfamily B protein